MKILYIITGLRFGGAEKLLYLTCKWLKQRYNCDLEIYYFDPIAPMRPLFDSIQVSTRQMRYRVKSLLAIARRVRSGKFDIVHTHLIHADVLGRLAVLLSGASSAVAVISTTHGTDWFRWQKGWFCDVVRTVDRLLSLPANSRILAISKSVKRMLVEREEINPAKIAVLYNAVEIPPWSEKGVRQPAAKSNFNCLYLGRLSREKNIPCLLRALGELRDLPIRLTIAGAGQEESRLKQLTAELSLTDRVDFQKPLADTKNFYRNHDVLVLPSVYEGLGLVILEAFSYGLPVIGSKVDGIAELLADERGLLFKSDDHLDLAHCLRQLYYDQEKRACLSKRAYEYVKQHHDIRDYVDSLHAMYVESLEKGTPKRPSLIEPKWIL
jgi:glycosyltransferase involved in cell wall biosynthesis